MFVAPELDPSIRKKDAGPQGVRLDAGSTPVPPPFSVQDASLPDVSIADLGTLDLGEGDVGTAPVLEFGYAPSNFDPAQLQVFGTLEIDTPCTLDTTMLRFDGCAGPTPVLLNQPQGGPIAVVAVEDLRITSSLRVVGDAPVLFAVYGKAMVSGTIDAGGVGAQSGAGGGHDCGSGAGGAGDDFSNGGGGGGGFGSPGAAGGGPGAGRAGALLGAPELVPLRGGCPGGQGGDGTEVGGAGGGAGGALQISAASELTIQGVLTASGGGGGGDPEGNNAGGGGGSGGAILLEADVLRLDGARLTANGGAGGSSGGALRGGDGQNGEDGHSADSTPAQGGRAHAWGGNGAASSEGAQAGDSVIAAADGGGGGGVGRLRLRARSCEQQRALFSPMPTLSCAQSN